MSAIDLSGYGIHVKRVLRNPAPAALYEEANKGEAGTAIVSSGALAAFSGENTGRSPEDKRIVENPESVDDIWWGPINMKLSEHVFDINRERVLDYFNTREQLYVIDAFAGADPDRRLKVRVVCERAYHALFMWNMLVRPSDEQLESFGDPDVLLLNAGTFPAAHHLSGVSSKKSVDLFFENGEMLVLGTQYAGEMKKGIFTVMNYLMPKRGVLSMHCSATEGRRDEDVSLFFGLSGTGKTTLSADPNRRLIGDDEHCWTDDGIFNIEGGCYAKTIDISPEEEPQIYSAIRFGTVLENVVYDERTRHVDYSDDSITRNTRASYPIHHIEDAKPDGLGGHPSNVIFLTCDAFGVLPPISRLTPEQAMYHFISGYTAKIPGTEVGITEPRAAFSACFGAPFLVWPPGKYAELLADRVRQHDANVWLVNTGWTGGPYGEGRRIELKYTRAMIDAIHARSFDEVQMHEHPVFKVHVPAECPDVPSDVLWPRNTWDDGEAYDRKAKELAQMFVDNFQEMASHASEEVQQAGPAI